MGKSKKNVEELKVEENVVELSFEELEEYVKNMKSKKINGTDLAELMRDGKISKSERRKITKLANVPESTPIVLSERQKLRLETKEKKSQPRIGKEDRREKFLDIALNRQREKEEARNTTCLACRRRGHFTKDCPNTDMGFKEEKELGVINDKKDKFAKKIDEVICFNCGSDKHSLRACLEPRDKTGKLPFANCFICKGKGHIARDCPENPNGIYPKGGCCHICLQKTHLVKDCPERTEDDKAKYRQMRIDREDAELGLRIAGLMEGEASTGKGGDDTGDGISIIKETHDSDEDDSDNDRKRKKSHKEKKHKKSKY
jgi:zinc finger CCHC domain-containing protein 9